MRIEFNTVFDNFANEHLAELYVKLCMDNQNKKYKQLIIFSIVLAALSFVTGIATRQYPLCPIGFLYFLFVFFIVRKTKKKTLPKSMADNNGVGCPYNVTFGLYDEYFYEKFENNMSISEQSIRYEFLKKIVETPECFILMTKRSQLYFLPKRDMGYEAALEFSDFCKARLPYIYSFKEK